MNPLTFRRGAFLICATTTLFALSLWCASPTFAATDGSDYGENQKVNLTSGSPAHTSSASFSGTVIRTIVGLLIVIAVIYGLSWFLKQTRSSRNPSLGEGLLPIATLPLGPNRSVALVRVGAELHLLGVGEHGVNGIRVFSEEEAYELGIPFDPEDLDRGRGIRKPARSLVDSVRRFTIR